MFRNITRAAWRAQRPAVSTSGSSSCRLISTQPPHLKSRSWKSSGLRWGIALAGLYYYNTSPIFAEQPYHNLLNPNVEPVDESETASVLEELTSRRSREAQKNHEEKIADATGNEPTAPAIDGGASELEEEAASEGAFNPETGEINWDCPCLGGMAHGPCGPQFREAFSCFVFSKEEPKGMDCIEKFQGMRDCFQEHPDVYRDELMEDEELDRELEAEKQELVNQIAERQKADEARPTHNLLEEPAPTSTRPSNSTAQRSHEQPRATDSVASSATQATSSHKSPSRSENAHDPDSWPSQSRTSSERQTRASSETQRYPEHEGEGEGQDSQVLRQPSAPPVRSDAVSESESLVPKAAHDARSSIGPGGVPPKKDN